MYLFYEHHRDATNKIILTEIKFSSSNTRWFISFKDQRENMIFEAAKIILKWPPVLKRSIDPTRWVWTYFEDYGEQVLAKIQETTKPLGGVTCIEIEDLFVQAAAQIIQLGKRKKIDAKEFFYNYGAPIQRAALSREQIQLELTKLLEISTRDLAAATKDDMKRLYRRAALRLHPDRNNGDGSKMSDLNMYWGLYNA